MKKNIKMIMLSFLIILIGGGVLWNTLCKKNVYIDDDEIPLAKGENIEDSFKDTYNTFENVDVLRNADLEVGDIVFTLGYHYEGDGGCGEYCITSDTKARYNKSSILLQNGLYAILISENEVKVEQFGAYGDGVHDDTVAIIDALNSEYKSIIFGNKIYKCSKRIVMNSPNKFVYGNNATLITDNDYSDDGEFFFLIKADDIVLDSLNIIACESKSVKYKTQLAIQKASHIRLNNCKFLIPDTVYKKQISGNKKEYTNLDLYSGWHDVQIKNCEIKNFSQCEAGGGIWIRDIWKIGASDLLFENNIISKSTHDEIIAVFTGSIENVIIRNNEIYMIENEVSSSSDFCLLFGNRNSDKCDNIIFENNKIDCSSSKYFVMFGVSSNVAFRNNEIKFTKIGNDTFYFFSTITGTTPDESNVIEGNKIVINTQVDLKRLYNSPGVYKNNVVTMNNKRVSLEFGHPLAKDGGENNIINVK